MNVFLVGSPLQLLNAIEARYKFNIHSNECLLLLCQSRSPYNRQNNDKQLTVLLEGMRWENVSFVSRPNKSYGWVTAAYKLRRIAEDIRGEVERVFIGDYRVDYLRNFPNLVQCQNVYLIDDGNGSIRLFKTINEHQMNSVYNYPYGLRSYILKIIKKIFGVYATDRYIPKFFTVYDFQEPSVENVIRNRYSYLANMSKNSKIVDEVFFIGTSLVEGQVMNYDAYNDYLGKICEYYANSHIVYIPHRNESADRIEHIRSRFGFEIRYFETCIEYALCTRGYVPSVIGSFYTAALENFQMIFGDRIRIQSFYFGTEHIDPSRRDIIEEIYDYYRSHLEVVDLRYK